MTGSKVESKVTRWWSKDEQHPTSGRAGKPFERVQAQLHLQKKNLPNSSSGFQTEIRAQSWSLFTKSVSCSFKGVLKHRLRRGPFGTKGSSRVNLSKMSSVVYMQRERAGCLITAGLWLWMAVIREVDRDVRAL